MKILLFSFILFSNTVIAQNMNSNNLSEKQKSIIAISAVSAKGDLLTLKTELGKGLEAGLTINEIREVLVHLYAYCGFPRSIRGLQTFMEVLEERKSRGINDVTGDGATPITDNRSKYERGREILGELTKMPQDRPLTGYNAFAPAIDVFLKEHLLADIFERDVLTYAERELVTISVLSAIGGAEPMLRSHLSISLNVGLTPEQLSEFVSMIRSTLGEKEAGDTQAVLDEVLNKKTLTTTIKQQSGETAFPKGEKITSDNFTGTVYLYMMLTPDSMYNTSMGNVTFEPRARTK